MGVVQRWAKFAYAVLGHGVAQGQFFWLTNAQIDEVLTLHEEQGLAYSALAERFGVSKSCIAGICQYRRRGQWVAAWRKVKE